ncbi:MAG: tRNA adenosine(34) deaminase TadA [Candidatus Adiutrix sp.]|jgi:tRNA(adenine34) deaminase|nr:tRNA adenosine(34) deaminase TadA [Candidatus Adiutrix sp.]
MDIFNETDYDFMSLALAQAARAAEDGEVPAGAVLVGPDGLVAGLGRNRVIELHDPTAHAEILAMREAAKIAANYRLTGLTLYSTLEPCPMCLMAAVHARLERVIFGAPEPRWGAAGSLIDLAALPGLNHRLPIDGGLLAEECGAMMQHFFKARRRGSSTNA